jgi:hypothetical protein
MLVEDLNISEALARRLCRMGLITVEQLLGVCVDDLQRGYWIGKGSISAIQNALVEIGFDPLAHHVPRQKIKRIMKPVLKLGSVR